MHPDDLEDFFSGKLPGSKEALNMMKDIEKEILEDKRFKDCIFLNFTWHFDEVYVPRFHKIGEKNGKDVYRELTEKEAMERKQIKIHCHFDLIPVVEEKVKVKIPLTDENGKQLKDKKGRLMYLKKLDENGKPIKEGKRWVYETEEIKRKSLNRTKLWKTKEDRHVRGDYRDDYKKYREDLIDRVNKRHKENNLVYSNFDEKLDKMLEMMNDDDLNTYLLNLTVEKMISAENYRKELNNEIEILEDKVDIYKDEAEKIKNNNLLEEKNLEETRNKKKIVDKELSEVEELTNEINTLNIMREQKDKELIKKTEMIKKLDKKLKEEAEKIFEDMAYDEAMKILYKTNETGEFVLVNGEYQFSNEAIEIIENVKNNFLEEFFNLDELKMKEVSENRELIEYVNKYFKNELKGQILERGREKEYGITKNKNLDDVLK